jgi:toxin-antitoxin system PIN domain toxin
VIVPDINLLVFAHNEAAPLHDRARAWWKERMSGPAPVAIPWAVTLGFVRLVTHPSVLAAPLTPEQALDCVDDWFGQDHVIVLEPGPRHLRITRDLFRATGVGGSLTTDTHLAALAIEHGAELHSNDRDFERFAGLRLRNPLAT